jgi:hypothetical protein
LPWLELRNCVASAGPRTKSRHQEQTRQADGAPASHINIDVLRASFFGLKKTAAPTVDEMTWTEYAEHLEANLGRQLRAPTRKARASFWHFVRIRTGSLRTKVSVAGKGNYSVIVKDQTIHGNWFRILKPEAGTWKIAMEAFARSGALDAPTSASPAPSNGK